MSYINSRTVHDLKYGGVRPPGPSWMDSIMSHMTASEMAACAGGTLISGSGDTLFSGISIDTRTLRQGDLFFAIRGARHDGHDYIPEALSRGGLGAVVDGRYARPEDYPQDRLLLRVRDTHQALKDVASEVRRRWRGSLVGITGSMGKTSTKDFLAHVLQTEYSVYRSPGNYNNLFGLPLAIFGLSPDDHIGVFEMGMSAPGEIAEMCRIAIPEVGIITNVAPVHLEFFDSVEGIARAKWELAEGLAPGGTLVYNADDARLKALAAGFSGNTITFGLSAGADIRAEEIVQVSLHETRFRLHIRGLERRAGIPLAGLHSVMNVLPAVVLGTHYRMDPDQILESLRHLRQSHMRGQILHFREGFTVIDDSYNSNPNALMQMIEMMCGSPGRTRRILVAGEMLELGPESAAFHRECGQWAARCGVDVLVAVQGMAREMASAAVEAGMPDNRVHFFTEVHPAADFVSRCLQEGDLLLIKGSRGVRLEKMVQTLRSHHVEVVS